MQGGMACARSLRAPTGASVTPHRRNARSATIQRSTEGHDVTRKGQSGGCESQGQGAGTTTSTRAWGANMQQQSSIVHAMRGLRAALAAKGQWQRYRRRYNGTRSGRGGGRAAILYAVNCSISRASDNQTFLIRSRMGHATKRTMTTLTDSRLPAVPVPGASAFLTTRAAAAGRLP